MIYNIKAIKTNYEGVTYKSRLEAQWAAFFDLCGWKYDYEPFTVDRWTPDFELHTPRERKLLVEIKPVSFQDRMVTDELISCYFQKALNHVHWADLLLIGQSPFEFENTWHIGVFVETSAILEDEIDSYVSLGCGNEYGDLYFHKDLAAFKPDGSNCGLSPYFGIWDDVFQVTHRKSFDDMCSQAKYLFRRATSIVKGELL